MNLNTTLSYDGVSHFTSNETHLFFLYHIPKSRINNIFNNSVIIDFIFLLCGIGSIFISNLMLEINFKVIVSIIWLLFMKYRNMNGGYYEISQKSFKEIMQIIGTSNNTDIGFFIKSNFVLMHIYKKLQSESQRHDLNKAYGLEKKHHISKMCRKTRNILFLFMLLSVILTYFIKSIKKTPNILDDSENNVPTKQQNTQDTSSILYKSIINLTLKFIELYYVLALFIKIILQENDLYYMRLLENNLTIRPAL